MRAFNRLVGVVGVFGVVQAAGVLGGVGVGVGVAQGQEAEKGGWTPTTPLIPREVIFGNPDKASPKLSPDGRLLAYLAPRDGVMNVWVAPVGDLKAARPVTKDTGRGIAIYEWAFDGAHLLYVQDDGGDENWKVHSVELATEKDTDLTPIDEIKGPDGKPIMLPTGKPMRPAAQLLAMSERFPNQALIGLNNRDPRFHDLYRVDIATGSMEKVLENNEFAGFVIDESFVPRLAVKQTEDGGSEWLRAVEEGKWEAWQRVPPEDALTTNPVGFDATGEYLYLYDSRGQNTARLVRVSMATGEATVLAGDERADADGVLVHPVTKVVQAVSFTYDRTFWRVLDQSVSADFDYLRGVANGEMHVAGRSQDDSRWLVVYAMDNGPARVYLYERDPARPGTPGKASFLFTNRARLEGLALARMHPVAITARDGLKLVSYLTLPVGSHAEPRSAREIPRPHKPLPMVLLVHGGPWARDTWGYNPLHQWLSNRGYAVLSVNFRGSTGLGKNFANAGDREWGAKMHDDLLDAVEWAVKEGVADRSRVAIMGGSYGGYATLVGLTFTPEVFACGVDIVGPSHLVTLLNSIPPYWAPMVELFAKRVGDHRTEEGRKFLESRSPLSRVDRIVRPLLIGQGANDPRVKQAESDQIVSAMQRRNIPVTYVVFPDEGHGFRRPENRMAFYAVTEWFLAQHLGGRAEPIGDDVRKSTAQVRVGAESIPGLVSADAPKVDMGK